MAGSYPDAPSRRMAHDDDGTIWLELNYTTGGVVQELTAADREEANDERTTSVTGLTGGTESIAVIFPELRELDGAFGKMDLGTANRLLSSGDTTNGFDGTWTERIASPWANSSGTVSPGYREQITSLAVSNVRGVRMERLSGSNQFLALHLYGEIAAGETPDRLLFFDNDDDLEFSKPQDYGDRPRGSAVDHQIYLRNNSATLAANSVQVTAEALFNETATKEAANWFTFSEGGAFSATLALASSISAAADSPVITVRLVIPDTGSLGLHAPRVYANTGSWT